VSERMGEGLLGPVGFTLLMFSMASCLPLFFLGPMAYQAGLSLGQALAAAVAGNGVVAAAIALNGLPGVRWRIGFSEHARMVFGRYRLAPVAARGVIGALWYGVEAFNGALAAALIVVYALGARGGEALDVAMQVLPAAIAGYAASIALVYSRGAAFAGRAAALAGPLMLAYFAWLAATAPSDWAGASGVDWGSAAFLAYLAVQTNWWATVAVNASDLTRAARDWASVWAGVFLGLVGGQALGTYLGYRLAATTGAVLPHEIILSGAPGAAAVLLGLSFALLAPWTTDVAANVPAVASLLESLGLKGRRAALVAGALGFVLAPWYLMGAAQEIVGYVASFAAAYGVLLGPVLGAMLAWLATRTLSPRGALAASALGVAAAYAYSLAAGHTVEVAGLPAPGGLAWYAGVAAALAAGLALTAWRRARAPRHEGSSASR